MMANEHNADTQQTCAEETEFTDNPAVCSCHTLQNANSGHKLTTSLHWHCPDRHIVNLLSMSCTLVARKRNTPT